MYGKVMYFEDIDYFKDFENEFPAIVYEDALTSESEDSSEPTDSDAFLTHNLAHKRNMEDHTEQIPRSVVLSVSSPNDPKSRVFPLNAFQMLNT
ncbi:hypothetical protein Tco_1066710 [Tanacetum coccineum]|uniref:Uncharacterized protein n=1 Tax=Tanacetum coccineum TaxID=301880 RepID=A0ABQ5HAR9_9ASTR